MRWLRWFLVVLTLVVLQTAVFPSLRVAGAAPDLLLVATVAVAFYRGAEVGSVFGFVAGLTIDCFLSSHFGISALAFCLVGFGVGVFQSGMLRSSRLVAPVLAGVGGLLGGGLWVVIAAIAGQDDLFVGHTIGVLIVAALYDALISFAVFPFVHWAAGDPEPARR
ncbi:MAG: rod shape-determining protein MreD [Actinomycetes bacterium]